MLTEVYIAHRIFQKGGSMAWSKLLAFISGEVDQFLLVQNQYLIEENRVLRSQIDKRVILTDKERIGLAERAIILGKQGIEATVNIVKPATILKWHRQLVAKKFDGSRNRSYTGRPPISEEIEKLIVKMAGENPSWGYDKIADAVRNLGHAVSDQTVGNILRRHGLDPSPERVKGESWSKFIERHKDVLWATDFFTSEVWTAFGLKTYYVLFFIHIATREVFVAGITDHPNEEWMAQMARNISGWYGELENAKYLIHDRDTKYCAAFKEIMNSSGVECIKLPPRSPNLNAFAERWVKTVKTECLNHFILFGRRSLSHVLKKYLEHYHSERNHQGLDHIIPFPDERLENDGDVTKSSKLGGLLNFYHRDAS